MFTSAMGRCAAPAGPPAHPWRSSTPPARCGTPSPARSSPFSCKPSQSYFNCKIIETRKQNYTTQLISLRKVNQSADRYEAVIAVLQVVAQLAQIPQDPDAAQ